VSETILGGVVAGLILTAVLGLGGLIGWVVKSRLEELQRAEERLASERRKLYAELLDPYIKILAGAKGQTDPEEVKEHILSVDYRKTALEVALIGNDEVVDAYNDLMQHFYKEEGGSSERPVETMRLLGVLLLAVRKSLGNAATELDEWDMLRHMIRDIDQTLQKTGIQRKRAAASPADHTPKRPPPKP
jgi:hypothetical protein